MLGPKFQKEKVVNRYRDPQHQACNRKNQALLHAFDECWRSPSPDIRATLSSGIAVARAELS